MPHTGVRTSTSLASQKTSPAAVFALLLGIAIALGSGFLLFGSSGRDDSHITFWAAHALANYGEIVNYNGERVEQSSSLLHVVTLALLHKLTGINLPDLGLLFCVTCGVISMVLAFNYARRLGPVARFATPLLLGTAPPFVYWTFGALESTFTAVCILGLMHGAARYLDQTTLRPPAILLVAIAAYLLVRPEAPFVMAGWLIASLIFVLITAQAGIGRVRLRQLAVMAGAAAAIVLLIFAFRHWYFGALFPQPVYAKAGGSHDDKLKVGLHYVTYYMGWPGFKFFWLAVAAGIVLSLLRQRGQTEAGAQGHSTSLAAGICAAWLLTNLSFIVAAGGDWMEAGRFLVPLLPLAALLAGHTLQKVSEAPQLISRRVLVGLGILLIAGWQFRGVLKLATVRDSRTTGIVRWAPKPTEPVFAGFAWSELNNRLHLRDIPVAVQLERIVGKLSPALRRPVSIMSQQGGFIPYHVIARHYGKATFLDMRGLITRHFTSCSVTNTAPRNAFGLVNTAQDLFEQWPEIKSACGIEQPDIIFDTSPIYLHTAEQHGYTVVYWQNGPISSGSDRLPGGRIRAREGIAVRTEYLKHLPANLYVQAPWRKPESNVARDAAELQSEAGRGEAAQAGDE